MRLNSSVTRARFRAVTGAGILTAGLVLAGCGEPKGDVARQVEAAAEKTNKNKRRATGPDYARTLDGVREAYHVVLENLAHAQTPGYRAVRPVFEDVAPAGRSDGNTVLQPVMRQDSSPGKPVLTGRWLDVAIDGAGYLILDDPNSGGQDALGYGRAGSLYVNLDNELVYGGPDGPRVEPIVVFPDEYADLRIEDNGLITALNRRGGRWMAVGQLHLARFANEDGLHASVTGRFVASAESGPPLVGTPGTMGLGVLLQKHLEGSNVNLAQELAELERLKDWGRSLAEALDVDPGFRDAPPVAVSWDTRVGPPTPAGPTASVSVGR